MAKEIHINLSGGRPDWPNLATGTETQLSVIRPLTEAEAIAYSKAHDVISSFIHSHWPGRILEDNIVELQNFLDATYERFKGGNLREYTDEFHVQANRHIMNFLASAGSFLAFTQKQHKRLFGKASKETQELLKAIEQAKAQSFDLRLTLQLRNYAAHYNLPLGGLEFSGRTNEKGEKIHTVIATFRTSGLLDDRDLDAKMRAEIVSAGNEIPVLRTLVGAMHEFDAILDVATSHLLPAAIPHAKFILALNKEVATGCAQIVRSIQTKFDRPVAFRTSMSPLFPERAEEILRQANDLLGSSHPANEK